MRAIEPDVSKWNSWRPEEVSALLRSVRAPWYVAGGWAIDLFPGEERRSHKALPLALATERLTTTHQTWVRDPDVILLFKARWAEEGENQRDFAAALPRLGAKRRGWLREALERVHPSHPWLCEIERCAA